MNIPMAMKEQTKYRMIISFMLARYIFLVHFLRQQTSIAKPVRKLTTSDAIAVLSGNVQISSIMAVIMQNQQHATSRIGIMTARMEPMTYDSFLFILFCPTTKLTCRYEAQRNSSRVQRFVRFCYYVPKLLLHFPFCALFRHTCEPRQSVPTDSVYL